VSAHRRVTVLLCSLALAMSLAAQDGLNSGEVVLDRYIVVYRNGIIPGDADNRALSLGARLLHRQNHLGIATVEYSHRSGIAARRTAQALSDGRTPLQELSAQPNVEYVIHDRLVTAHKLRVRAVSKSEDPTFSVITRVASAYDTYYNSPQGWAVRQIGGYGAGIPGGLPHGPWDITTGKGVRIAILDSGVDPSHPDIAPNLALNLTEIDPAIMPSVCDDGSPLDQAGHGTWAASLAAAASGPGTGRLIGVAPAATLLNIKVLERMPTAIPGANNSAQCEAGESSGLLSWVIQGIDDAISNHADVISLSLGLIVDVSTGDGAGVKAAFDRVAYAAMRTGAVLVAAAGNDGYNLSNTRYIEIPAQSRGVLAVVAATNSDCMENTRSGAACIPGPPSLAYYSNYGAPLDALAAPGGSYPSGGDMAVSGWVRGACSSGLPNTTDGLPIDSGHSFGCFDIGHAAYVQAIGTSASAPLVAGAAALLRAAHPDWDSIKIVDTLRSTATLATPALPIPEVNLTNALAAP